MPRLQHAGLAQLHVALAAREPTLEQLLPSFHTALAAATDGWSCHVCVTEMYGWAKRTAKACVGSSEEGGLQQLREKCALAGLLLPNLQVGAATGVL